MKSIIILALAMLVTVYADDKYTTENDNFDIKTLVGDVESFRTFANCFNDKGPCDAVSADFKKDMSEAVLQACRKCTDAQKRIFNIFLGSFKEKLPAEYEIYKNKYDSENKYLPALQAAVANYN